MLDRWWHASLEELSEKITYYCKPEEHSFVAGDYSDRDLYVSSRTQERALNSAIVRAEISESFEEYLEIFDAFYADDIEISGETAKEPIRGKGRVGSILANFLVPLSRDA